MCACGCLRGQVCVCVCVCVCCTPARAQAQAPMATPAWCHPQADGSPTSVAVCYTAYAANFDVGVIRKGRAGVELLTERKYTIFPGTLTKNPRMAVQVDLRPMGLVQSALALLLLLPAVRGEEIGMRV